MAQTQPQSVWLDYIRDYPQTELIKLIRGQEKTNRWFLMGVLGVGTIQISEVDADGNRTYTCLDRDERLITSVTLPHDMPLKDKIAVIRTAVRMSSHGHNH